MNREIKFRAWDEDEQRMVYSAAHQLFDNYLAFPWKDHLGEMSKPLMQFTGLKDKDGKEIYEGDIVRVIHEDRPYSRTKKRKSFDCEVIFNNGGFDYQWPKPSVYGNYRCGSDLKSSEIIGNIYENKELLK